MEKYNKEELKKIAHSLGIRLFESVMSHTTTDCITRFKRELRYFKNIIVSEEVV